MRILLTGASGQLGRHLSSSLRTLGEVVTTDRTDGDFKCDLSDRRLVDRTLERVRPDLVVNPAAWTAVDRAEDEEAAARRMNADLPGWLAAWCADHNALLLHFSTDYVFSGASNRGWCEADVPAPGNAYGRTKLAGERVIFESGARALIVRTAWLYSHFPGNFLSAILSRAEKGEKLKIVSDQIGSPTWAGHLADAGVELIRRADRLESAGNIFHFAGAGAVSWHEFGTLVIEHARQAGLLGQAVEVAPIASAAWPQKARRPVWSVLDCTRYEEFTGLRVPNVEQGLEACLKRWKQAT